MGLTEKRPQDGSLIFVDKLFANLILSMVYSIGWTNEFQHWLVQGLSALAGSSFQHWLGLGFQHWLDLEFQHWLVLKVFSIGWTMEFQHWLTQRSSALAGPVNYSTGWFKVFSIGWARVFSIGWTQELQHWLVL